MNLELNDYREILGEELKKRCDANANYSLRAFAIKLKIPASTLSEVLNHKAGLSIAKANLISEKLNFNDVEKEYFVTLVEGAHARSKRARELAKIRLLKFQKTHEKQVDMDTWNLIAEWYHVGILELSKVRGFQSEPKWIAAKLGISAKEARHACDRLIRLGILRLENKKLKPTGQWLLKSPTGIPSDSIKQFHLNLIKKASDAIYNQSVDERNYSSLLMAIDTDKISDAKKLIADFNTKMTKLLTSSTNCRSLYCFGTQLFRVGDDV